MKKLISLSILLLGAIFLAGCSQQQTSQTKSSTPTPAVQQPTQPAISTAQATKFLEKYCRPIETISGIETWGCDEQSGLFKKYKGTLADFAKECQNFGYHFSGNLVGVMGGQCYKFTDTEKICNNSYECQSSNCKPEDDNCTNNCQGKCSAAEIPDECNSEIVKIKIIENNKVIEKSIGGKDCSNRIY